MGVQGRARRGRRRRRIVACCGEIGGLVRERAAHFHEFMADGVAMVERTHALARLEMTPESRRALDRFVAENPLGRHGRVIYDPKADFDIEPTGLWRRLGYYFERLPIQAE